jgi:hypothetical protein
MFRNIKKGFSLIEIIIYIAIFSSVLLTFIGYYFSVLSFDNKDREQVIKSINGGFIAFISLFLISMIAMGQVFLTAYMTGIYADSVNRKELRIQAKSNLESCINWVEISLRKDRFLSGIINVPQFGCDLVIEPYTENNSTNNTYDVHVTAKLEFIKVTDYIRITI